MSDNDIYYDETFKEQVEAFMLSIGYELVSKDNHHYVYKKPPIYNFEMHHSLFEETSQSQLCKYYSDLEKRLIKDEDSNVCRMSDEDFYI